MLPPHPDSIGEAREHVRGVAEPFVEVPRLDDLLLAISEVMSNAVRHGSTEKPIHLAAAPIDDCIHVQVVDAGPGMAPEPRRRSTPDGGWGFFLIESLTRRWGLMRDEDRTHVWFEFGFDA